MQPYTSSSHGRASLGRGRAWEGHNASKCGGCRRCGASEEDQVRGKAWAHGSVVQRADYLHPGAHPHPIGISPKPARKPPGPILTDHTEKAALPPHDVSCTRELKRVLGCVHKRGDWYLGTQADSSLWHFSEKDLL